MALNPYNDAYPPKGYLPTEQAADKDFRLRAQAQITQIAADRDRWFEKASLLQATLAQAQAERSRRVEASAKAALALEKLDAKHLALVERVRALVNKWRQAADDPNYDGTAEGETALNCADELAQLLSPQQKGE